MVRHFFDTYAVIEITKNSPNYLKYADEPMVFTRFNLAELVFIILDERGEEAAKEALAKFRDAAEEVPEEILFKAMLFRLRNRKRGFSYADCIGYIFAKENRMLFLTGDDAFKGMEGVEFVK